MQQKEQVRAGLDRAQTQRPYMATNYPVHKIARMGQNLRLESGDCLLFGEEAAEVQSAQKKEAAVARTRVQGIKARQRWILLEYLILLVQLGHLRQR